jgi:hypothetical protein
MMRVSARERGGGAISTRPVQDRIESSFVFFGLRDRPLASATISYEGKEWLGMAGTVEIKRPNRWRVSSREMNARGHLPSEKKASRTMLARLTRDLNGESDEKVANERLRIQESGNLTKMERMTPCNRQNGDAFAVKERPAIRGFEGV